MEFNERQCISLCIHCLPFCYWAPSRGVRLPLIYSLHLVFTNSDEIPMHLLFSRLNHCSSLSFSSKGTVLLACLWPFPGLSPVAPCLSGSESRAGHSSPGVASPARGGVGVPVSPQKPLCLLGTGHTTSAACMLMSPGPSGPAKWRWIPQECSPGPHWLGQFCQQGWGSLWDVG